MHGHPVILCYLNYAADTASLNNPIINNLMKTNWPYSSDEGDRKYKQNFRGDTSWKPRRWDSS